MLFSKNHLVAGCACALAAFLAAGLVILRNVQVQRQHAAWVSHTYEVLTAVQTTLTTLVDTETGQRGYLLTGAPRYLEPYQAGLARLPECLRSLRDLTRDNPRQTQRNDRLDALVAAKLKELAETIDLRRTDPAAALQIVASGQGQAAMDRIRELADAMDQEERALLARRTGEYATRYWITQASVVLALLLGMAALAGLLAALLRHLQDRDRCQATLEQRHQLAQVTLRSIGDGLITTGPAGDVTFLNPVAERLTGWETAAAQGRSVEEVLRIVNEETGAPAVSPVERVLREGVVLGLANHSALVHRDGSRVPIQDSAAPIRHTDGSVAGVVLVFQDMSSKRLAEQERRRFQEQMAQAQKMESLAALVAGVAHNFNNLLAVIMGTSSMWEGSAPSPEERQAFQTITQACDQGRNLVHSLVQFSRPALARQGPVDVNRLVSEVDYLLEHSTRNRVGVVRELAAGPAWILGDERSLSSALVNLGLNAVDAMAGGGTLTLRVAVPEPDLVEVIVRDTGAGMTPEVLGHAVEPFFTTKPVGQGTGLGLSMAHGVVQVHGGTLALASTPGQGTTVSLRLPRIPAPAEGQRPPAAMPPPGPAPAVPRHVLLVDDEDSVRFLTDRILRRSGVEQVETFASGEEALERLASGPLPTLVILDQNMPGLTGAETMERIRRDHPDLPVLISSGQPDIQNWECFRRPHTGVISKPFTIPEIQQKLGELAGPPGGPGTAAAAPGTALPARPGEAVEVFLGPGERWFRQALRHAPVSLAVQGPDLRYLWAFNQRTAGPEDILGHRDADLFTPDQAAHLEAVKRRVLEQGVGCQEELWLDRPDGRIFLSVSWEPVREGGGPVIGVSSATIDLTRLKLAEDALRASEETLERRVEERTAALVAANQELEAFTAAVSHDLRAPLRALAGYSEALAEDCGPALPDAARRCLEGIVRSGRRMGEMIDGLLVLARFATGEAVRRPVDLSALAEAARQDLEQDGRDRRVVWRIEPGLRASGDERMLQVALANLLGNAWKYSSGREVAHIAFEAVEEAGTRLFQVTDDGAGFDMARADRLFRPFQRLHGPEEFPGLGVGLATVQRIIRRHGGRIEASSEPGRGAAFRFTLPDPEEPGTGTQDSGQ